MIAGTEHLYGKGYALLEWSAPMDSNTSARSNPKRASTSRYRLRKVQRHEEILAAAFEEFAARGYAEARLDDLPLLQEQRTSLLDPLAPPDSSGL